MSAAPQFPAPPPPFWPLDRRAQAWEVVMLVVIYLLQVCNAELLRRAALLGHGTRNAVTQAAFLLATKVHPVAMVVLGVWLAVVVLLLLRGRRLPRWVLDGPGLWLSLRLLLEFLTINGLIFAGSGVVGTGVLLGQIVIYLPFFVLTWGWIFHRFDRVGQDQPGRVLLLLDADPTRGINSFDYYHSSLTTLLYRGKPTISGVSRRGRVLVLIHQVMLLALYAVAFARILQLTRAVV